MDLTKLLLLHRFSARPSPQLLLVSAGQAGTLTFTIINFTGIALDNLLGFTDIVPAGITVTGLNTNGCPGSVVTTATNVTYTTVAGNVLGSFFNCTITVNIVGVTLGGPCTNTVIGNKSLTGQTPTAQITVIAPPDSFVVRYAANLTNGDAVIDLSNTGANGNIRSSATDAYNSWKEDRSGR